MKQGKQVEASVKCLDILGLSSIEKIELAGRICYNSEDKIEIGSAEKFVRGIMKRGHESVIEHEGFIIRFDGNRRWDETLIPLMLFSEESCLFKVSIINGIIFVSGNFRVWRDFLKASKMQLPFGVSVNDMLPEIFKIPYSTEVLKDEEFKYVTTTSKIIMEDVGLLRSIRMKHGTLTFRIDGVSRAMTHQLVRHRLCAYSQRSQRYCGEKDFNYIAPPCIVNPKKSSYIKIPCITEEHFAGIMNHYSCEYENLQDNGLKNEDARFVLPNACETNIVVTATLNQWLHMIKLRTTKHAQWEIRQVMKLIHEEIVKLIPDSPFDNIKFEED